MPRRRELQGTFCDRATSDREGRDGVNPSTTLRCVNAPRTSKCCRVDVGLAP
jgi:hypothetical protein